MILERVREKHMKIVILREKNNMRNKSKIKKTLNKKTSKRYYKRTNKNKVYKRKLKKLGGTDDGTDEPPQVISNDGERRRSMLTQLESKSYLHGTYGKIKDGKVLFSEPEKDEIERVLLEIDTRENQGEDTLETFATRVNKTYSDLYSKLIKTMKGYLILKSYVKI